MSIPTTRDDILRFGSPLEPSSTAATRAASPASSLRSALLVEEPQQARVVLVGIGGATCSGKTTLAKHLRSILPDCQIVHQDDFAPPAEKVPIHPVHNVQDWDSARGAIDWPRLRNSLRYIKTHAGQFPQGHYSHDHLNEQKDCPVPPAVIERWTDEFAKLAAASRAKGVQLVWRILDGFLLYWEPGVVAEIDVRVFLRVPHAVLEKRRHERHGYHTAVQSDPEGALWRDPPGYWEQIVWPAYVAAHRRLFVNGDIERGAARTVDDPLPQADAGTQTAEAGGGDRVDDLVVLEGMEMSMEEMVEKVCSLLRNATADCIDASNL